MKLETAEYKCVGIGPGGRYCYCCAPPSKLLKRLEHRKARRNEKKHVQREMESLNENN